jgi:predicted DsbA family dithiol-disulfide isomerase
VQWRAFPLHPETPEEGKSLEELFAGSTINIPRMLEHLAQVADSLGLPFCERKKTYNSRLAQELGLWAESEGKGHFFHMAAFHAYFAEGLNLAKPSVVLQIAEKAGLDIVEAEKVINDRSYSTHVLADWQLSRKKGITAVPTFIMQDAIMTGAQPYKDLVRFITSASDVSPRILRNI